MTKRAEQGQVAPAVDDAVLSAAGRLFRARGFAATTVREIASAAHMLPGSLHYRYKSKDDILVALMERGVRNAMDAVRRVVEGIADPIERVRAGLTTHLELLCEKDDSLFVLLFDWRSLPEGAHDDVARLRTRYESFWDGLLYEAWGTGAARPGVDLELLRNFGFGAINWVATWYRPGGHHTPQAIAEAFFSTFAFGVLDRPIPKEAE